MTTPRITTILPTYHRPEKLRRAINSVLCQTLGDLVLCIYDNGSDPETAAVASAAADRDPRVRYHRHPANIGAIGNFLYGMERVETPFFSFLSDDDVLLPGFYAAAVAAADRHPAAAFVATPIIHVDAEGAVLEPFGRFWWREAVFEPPAGLLAMLEHGPPTWTSILFRREVISTVGLLDPEVDGPSDFDYEMRVAAHMPFAVDPTPGGVLFLGEGGGSSGGQVKLLWPAWPRMIAHISEDERLDPAVRAQAEQSLTASLLSLLFKCGIGASRRGRFADARQAAELLRREYGRWRQAAIIDVVRIVCRLPVARWLLTMAVVRSRPYVRRGGRAQTLNQYLESIGQPPVA